MKYRKDLAQTCWDASHRFFTGARSDRQIDNIKDVAKLFLIFYKMGLDYAIDDLNRHFQKIEANNAFDDINKIEL